MVRYHEIITLADLIEKLDPEPYIFTGHYWGLESPELRKQLKFHCEFTHDDLSVIADWQSGPFQVRIPLRDNPLHGAIVQLFVREFGNVPGQLTFSDGDVIFAGSNEVVVIFAHICFDERNVIIVSGTFELNGLRFAYTLNGSRDSGPASVANVYPLKKQAR